MAATVLIGCHGSFGEREGDRTKVPVVFVHGSGLSAASWRELQEGLIEQRYPKSYLHALDIRPVGAANDHAAERSIGPQVATALGDMRRRGAGESAVALQVDLIGHSMGAFSSRYYAVRNPQHVRVWIGIAGANHGTNALCRSADAGDMQMCPAFATTAQESRIQAELNGVPAAPRDPTPHGLGKDGGEPTVRPAPHRCIAYFTIRIEPDEWIKPERSALLDGAGGLPVSLEGLPVIETAPGNFLFTGETNHDDLPKHPQVIELVTRILRAADEHWAARCSEAAGNEHPASEGLAPSQGLSARSS